MKETELIKLSKKITYLSNYNRKLLDDIDLLNEEHYFEIKNLKYDIFFTPKIMGIIKYIKLRKEYLLKGN